jgi:hypothetical protein
VTTIYTQGLMTLDEAARSAEVPIALALEGASSKRLYTVTFYDGVLYTRPDLVAAFARPAAPGTVAGGARYLAPGVEKLLVELEGYITAAATIGLQLGQALDRIRPRIEPVPGTGPRGQPLFIERRRGRCQR